MRLLKWMCVGVLGLGVILIAGSAARAQINTANLSGQVLDPQNLPVAGAKITVKSLATGAIRTAETDDSGGYRILGLPPGRYEVTVEAKGLAKLVNPEIVLTIGEEGAFDAHLQLQRGAESITVTEATPVIETNRTSVATTIDQRRIDNLPINGRNYIDFARTTSQATLSSAPFIGAAPDSGLSIGGQRGRSNQVSVDGADYVDNSINGIRSTVSQEAAQEFQIILSSYMPEFGRATGGVINIVTKGGTNEVHGNVFGFLRHSSIQARNPFSVQVVPDASGNLVEEAVKQPFTRVQAGATLGGPIQKDKTFYFFSYETTRRQETGFTSIGANNFGFQPPTAIPCIPVPLVLTQGQIGFYTAALGPFSAAGACASSPMARALEGAALFTGGSSNVALDGALGVVGPALGIPAAFGSKFFPLPVDCNPAIPGNCTAVNLVPLPASFVALNSLRGNYPVSEGTSVWSARLDHIWNTRNTSFVRANVSPSLVTGIQVQGQTQNFGANAASRTSLQQYRDVAVVGQHVTSFTSTLFNEARFQFARRGLHYGFAQFPGGGNPAVDIFGFASFGREPFSTVDRIERRYQWMDNLSYIKGRHAFKFGFDYNLLQIRSSTDQVFQLDYGGLYRIGSLSSSSTGLPTSLTAVQAYGLGVPGSFLQGIGTSGRTFNNIPIAFFVQDSWKIHPRLTLNYGVRYDVEISPLFTPDPKFNAAAEAALGVIEGIPRDTDNWAPRIGLAWDPKGDAKTVVRAGYGIFYDHPPLATPFLSATADGALSSQLTIGPGKATRAAITPLNACCVLNASSLLQGIFNQGTFTSLFYQAVSPNGQLNPQRFDPLRPDSFFVKQNFLAAGAGLPLTFLPFTFPVAANFVYGYAQQGNLTIERQLGQDYRFSVAYTYTHALHLNRPRNINSTDPKVLLSNASQAINTGYAPPGTNPLAIQAPIGTGAPGCIANNPVGGGSAQVVYPGVFATLFGAPNCAGAPVGAIGTAAAFNFFRPSGPNPSFAALPGLSLAALQAFAGAAGFPTGPAGVPIPFSDASEQESSGNSVYHGLTVALSKRFGHHFEFLSSYTFSHAIDDSTDLESPLNPQNNRAPNLERSNSTFDQRHRWVTSAVFQSPYKRNESGWWPKLLADFTLAPIITVASGRPFNIITGTDYHLDFGPTTNRPSVASAGGVTSPFIPGVHFVLPNVCPISVPGITDTQGLGCTGNLARNRFTGPGFFQMDLRLSRKFFIGERWNVEVIADGFNILNRNNTSGVTLLCDPGAPLSSSTGAPVCFAGQPASAFDARQFQFALKVNW